ncbi:MAG: DUF86 domain-containing protein [Euryarchaeota archaeon]|nr:DUF86 domain-containing protein [Euryarchaeota archaeon]MEA1997928.1 DUF86 domain-containing protein [Euryarchaeota archaeon]
MTENEAFLRHILDEIEFLANQCAELQFQELMEDEVLKRACVRSLEVIGEATKNLPEEFKEKYPMVEWKKIAGLRDKLIHHYFGINWDIVWDVIENKLPDLEKEIRILIEKEYGG